MTIAPSIDAGFQAFRRALLRGYFWFATTLLGAAFLIDAAILLDGPAPAFWVALPTLAVIWISAVVFAQTPFPSAWRVITLTPVASAAACWYAFAVEQFVTVPGGTAAVPLTFVKIGIATIGAMAERWTSGPLGTLIGYTIAEIAITIGTLSADGTWMFDGAAVGTVLGIAIAQLIVGGSRAQGRTTARVLNAAGAVVDLERERDVLETQSRALVHDTILNELAVLATTRPGALSERAVEQLRRSLDLVGAAELAPPSAPRMTAGLIEVVDRFRDAGLEIEVTGDPAVLDRLDAESAQALNLAIEQCLVNVVRHADTGTAELVVTPEGDHVSVMVIDDGVGFDPESIDSGRLGLRDSVRGRIEPLGGQVRLWSRPGAGTSVMLSVPLRQEGRS